MAYKKLFINVLIFLMLVSFATAFTIDVVCPKDSVAPGEKITCDFNLIEDVATGKIFGAQFVISATGFTADTTFFTATAPVLGSSSGLGKQTLLYKMTADGQSKGNLGKANFVAGTTAGTYDITITPEAGTDLTGGNKDTIKIVATDPNAAKKEICNNGIDDDGKGGKDCADLACSSDPACADGKVANGNSCFSDKQCVAGSKCTNNLCGVDAPKESNCADGKDDDSNGNIDCADSACVADNACTPGTVANGKACATTSQCLSSSTCKAGICTAPVDPNAGTTQITVSKVNEGVLKGISDVLDKKDDTTFEKALAIVKILKTIFK